MEPFETSEWQRVHRSSWKCNRKSFQFPHVCQRATIQALQIACLPVGLWNVRKYNGQDTNCPIFGGVISLESWTIRNGTCLHVVSKLVFLRALPQLKDSLGPTRRTFIQMDTTIISLSLNSNYSLSLAWGVPITRSILFFFLCSTAVPLKPTSPPRPFITVQWSVCRNGCIFIAVWRTRPSQPLRRQYVPSSCPALQWEITAVSVRTK